MASLAVIFWGVVIHFLEEVKYDPPKKDCVGGWVIAFITISSLTRSHKTPISVLMLIQRIIGGCHVMSSKF